MITRDLMSCFTLGSIPVILYIKVIHYTNFINTHVYLKLAILFLTLAACFQTMGENWASQSKYMGSILKYHVSVRNVNNVNKCVNMMLKVPIN